MPTWWKEEKTGKRVRIEKGIYISTKDGKFYKRQYKISGDTCTITDDEITQKEYEELLNNKKDT